MTEPDNLDDSKMEITQQNTTEQMSVDETLHNALDENETSVGNTVLHCSKTTREVENLCPELSQQNITEEIENLSQKLSQHNITEEIEKLSQKLTPPDVMAVEIDIITPELSQHNLTHKNLSPKNNTQSMLLSVTNEGHVCSQSEVNTNANTCFHLSQNNRISESQQAIPNLCHSTVSVGNPQMLHSESKQLECQFAAVTGVDYGQSSKDFTDDKKENYAVAENTLLHDEYSTYKMDKNEFISNLIDSHIDEIYQNSLCDRALGKVLSDKNDKNKCDETFSTENTFTGSDNADANVQTGILHHHLSEYPNHNATKDTEVNSSAVLLFKHNFVSTDAKDPVDDPKEIIETTFDKDMNETITDCVHPETCDDSILMTSVDQIENTRVPLQQNSLTIDLAEKQPETEKSDQTIELQEEQTEHLSPNLNQSSIIEDQICLCDKDDKMMMSSPVTNEDHKSNKSDIKPQSQTINSCLQFRNQQNQPCFFQPMYSSSVVLQDLLNTEQKTPERSSQNITDVDTRYSNNDNSMTMCHAANQNTIVNDEQNGYKLVECELFEENLEQEVQFFAIGCVNSTNNKNTIQDVIGHETNNMLFNHNQNNASTAQNIDINSSCNYDCQICAVVSDTLKDILIQCEKLNNSSSNKNVEKVSKSVETGNLSPKYFSMFSTEVTVPSNLKNKSLIPRTELFSKSPNTGVTQQDDHKPSPVHTIVDEEHTSKLRQNEENLNSFGSCVSSADTKEIADKSNSIHIANPGQDTHLVIENKFTPDMGYENPSSQGFIKDAKSEIKQSELEPSHGLRDQIVPEQAENMEMISDCTFYEKERSENNLKDVPLKNKHDFATTQCFKWRYTPSLGLHDDVPDEVPKFEDNLRNLPILKTCSRPIRIGLSRRQRAERLHSIPWKK